MSESSGENNQQSQSLSGEVIETPYAFFEDPKGREEIYQIGKNLSHYVKEEDIKNVIFLTLQLVLLI